MIDRGSSCRQLAHCIQRYETGFSQKAIWEAEHGNLYAGFRLGDEFKTSRSLGKGASAKASGDVAAPQRLTLPGSSQPSPDPKFSIHTVPAAMRVNAKYFSYLRPEALRGEASLDWINDHESQSAQEKRDAERHESEKQLGQSPNAAERRQRRARRRSPANGGALRELVWTGYRAACAAFGQLQSHR